MRPWTAAALLLALAAAPLRAAEPPPEAPARLEERVHEDLNALRRARYAWHKAQKDGSGQEEAHRGWQEAKEKLKADRLRLRELRKRSAAEERAR